MQGYSQPCPADVVNKVLYWRHLEYTPFRIGVIRRDGFDVNAVHGLFLSWYILICLITAPHKRLTALDGVCSIILTGMVTRGYSDVLDAKTSISPR
jgi:hypothetical protein